MEQFQSISEVLRLLRRRVTVWLPIAFVGIVASIFYAIGLPREYETTAVIQIGTTQISDRLTAAENRASSAQYLRKVEQRIMARDNLLEVIEKYNLFGDGSLSAGEKVYALRLSTRIEQVIDPGQAWQPNAVPSAMTVTVRLSDPDLVAVIANEFVERVLNQNTQSRLLQANQTFEFFKSEEQRVGQAIASLDADIATFKTENADSLPLALAAQQDLLVSLEEAALELDQEIVVLNNNKSKIRAAEFKQQMQLASDQRQLIQDRIETINAAIVAGPAVEREFSSLTRSLAQLEAQYTVITRNRSEAEMSRMLETTRQSETLIVLEEALVPDQPAAPNKKKIVFLGAAISVVAAGIVVLILELMNPVIRNVSQMERQLQMSPVVTIPYVQTRRDKIRRRSGFVFGGVLSVIGVWYFVQLILNTGG